jgi:putative MATE family efflux protein
VFGQGLYLLAAVSLVFVIVLKTVAPGLVRTLIGSAAVAEAVDSYLQIFAFAMLFHGVNLALSAFYVGVSRTRALIGATVVLAAVNVFLDYALIFGNLGFPELGIRGAAIGSLSAEIAAFAFLVIHAVLRGYHQRYGLFAFARWNRELSRRLMVLSSPVALDALVETVRWFAFFLIIESLGETALASANIVFGCYALMLIPIHGFSETTCSMVSNLVGQEQDSQIGALVRRAISLGYTVVLPLALFSFLFPTVALSLFTTDPEILATSVSSLRIVALGFLFLIPGDILFNAVVGTGDTAATLVIEVISTICVLGLASVFVFGLEFPLASVWVAEVAGVVTLLTLSGLWLRSGRWMRLTV